MTTNKKNYVRFAPFVDEYGKTREGLGWYYTTYNPETKEGKGWFGTESEPSYFFEYELIYDPNYGAGGYVLKSRTCGIGQGCFWSDFQ